MASIQSPRRILGVLDPNTDLNSCRGKTRRLPITFDQENAEAVVFGINYGTYEAAEVRALTNYSIYPPPSAPTGQRESDDEELGAVDFAREVPVDGEVEMDDDFEAHDDELLGEVIDEEEDHGHDEHVDSDEPLQSPIFDPATMGLKEINNLAHFGVSSHKPGNGVEELLSDDLDKYWQSDGQQPHLLTIHFLRRVEIRAMRFYVDYNQDESYTPTHIVFYAGTGNHDLIQFAEVPLNNPVGWQDVPIADCGGGPDGHSLCCWVVQMHIKENHQNGKDTHIRGIKIFALDENSAGGIGGDASRTIDNAADQSIVHSPVALNTRDPAVEELLETMDLGHSRYGVGDGNPFGSSDFMRDPEIR